MTEALRPEIDPADRELLTEFVDTLATEVNELVELARTLDRRLRPTAPAITLSAAPGPERDLATVLQDAEQASALLTFHLAEASALVVQLSRP